METRKKGREGSPMSQYKKKYHLPEASNICHVHREPAANLFGYVSRFNSLDSFKISGKPFQRGEGKGRKKFGKERRKKEGK